MMNMPVDPLTHTYNPTKQRSFPPISIPNLNVVIPTQTAFIQIHGGEVQNDLEEQMEMFQGFNIHTCSRKEEENGNVSVYGVSIYVCLCTFSPGVTDILQTQCVYDG